MSRIALGVSAGVAIYKSADLASRLTQRGDIVRTLMTPNALKFMAPLTFRAVTRQDVYTDAFEDDPGYRPEHISLADWADVFVIAPATADLIARIATGLGDNLLTVTLLAYKGPVVVAPAMNNNMWTHPIVEQNVAKLRETLGYRIVPPDTGHLACGSFGPGRLADGNHILSAIDEALESGSP